MTKGQEEADDEAVGADEGSAAAPRGALLLHTPSAGQSTVQSRFTSWQSGSQSETSRSPRTRAHHTQLSYTYFSHARIPEFDKRR